MGFGRFIHLIGSVLLLAATALLVVACISAPVVNPLAILKVDLGDSNAYGSAVDFGTFGYCVRGASGGDQCSKRHIGYNPANLMAEVDGTDFSDATRKTTHALSNVMILHAVGAALTFVAFLLSLFASIVGGFLAAIGAVVAFIVTVVALVCDFVSWELIRHDVNKSSTGSKASFGPAIYCVLAAGVLSLIAAILVFITCCAGRHKSRSHASADHNGLSSHKKGEKAGWWNNPNPWEERRMLWNPRGKW